MKRFEYFPANENDCGCIYDNEKNRVVVDDYIGKDFDRVAEMFILMKERMDFLEAYYEKNKTNKRKL